MDARIGPQGRDEIARLAASVNTMADARSVPGWRPSAG
ncbi:HAMP domain-containing protein [Streptomyces sp. R28]|uniref:HAMP domain-containing protein n=1 Tax=Streptomyces sp. R28 TaxID=3238628 RepID=A0AB39QDZ2_9ACTN